MHCGSIFMNIFNEHCIHRDAIASSISSLFISFCLCGLLTIGGEWGNPGLRMFLHILMNLWWQEQNEKIRNIAKMPFLCWHSPTDVLFSHILFQQFSTLSCCEVSKLFILKIIIFPARVPLTPVIAVPWDKYSDNILFCSSLSPATITRLQQLVRDSNIFLQTYSNFPRYNLQQVLRAWPHSLFSPLSLSLVITNTIKLCTLLTP